MELISNTCNILHCGLPSKNLENLKKTLTNFPVMENTWKLKEKVRCPGKILCCPRNQLPGLLLELLKMDDIAQG